MIVGVIFLILTLMIRLNSGKYMHLLIFIINPRRRSHLHEIFIFEALKYAAPKLGYFASYHI